MGKCLFQDLWLDKSEYKLWLCQITWTNIGSIVLCSFCKKGFQLGKMGEKALQTHQKGKKHSDLEKMRLMSSQPDGGPSPVKTRAMGSKGKAQTNGDAGTRGDGQEVFVQTVQSALAEDLVTRKNSKYNMAFFNTMVQKYPNVFWPLVSTVVKSLESPDTKVHSKTQACSLLVQLLRLNKRDSLSEEQWGKFYSSVPPVLKKLALGQQKGELKAGLLLEVLTALFHLTHLTSIEERKDVLSAELLSHLTQLKGSFNKDTRKMHNKLTQLLAQASHKDKKGKKRKHQESEGEGTGFQPNNSQPVKKSKNPQED